MAMVDEMKINDKEVKAVVKCAKCGAAVKSNEAHICKEQGEQDEQNSEKN